jgi:hypothetical protein
MNSSATCSRFCSFDLSRLAMAGGLLVAALVAACDGDGHDELDAVILDDASDEVLRTLVDAARRGQVTVDDTRAALLVSPTDGASLSATEAATWTWAPAPVTLLHGRNTGDFVWLRIECAAMVPIDVLAIETISYTPEAEHWDKITAASGACTSTLTSAFVDRGVIQEGGPFRPTQVPTFSVE